MTDDKPARGILTPAMESKMRQMLDTEDPRAPGTIWVQFSVDHEGGDICVEDIHLEDPPKYHTVRYVRARLAVDVLVTETAADLFHGWLLSQGWREPPERDPDACGMCEFRAAMDRALKEGQ